MSIVRRAILNGTHNNPWPPGIELSRHFISIQDKDGKPLNYVMVVEEAR